MKLFRTLLLAVASVATFAAQAGDLAPEVEAKFLKVIVSSTGTSRIACADPVLKAALEAQGVTVDPSAQVIWVTGMSEARAGKAMGKLVITPKRDLVASVAVLLEEDGGRPKIFLNTSNLHAAKVQLGDTVLKITEKI